MIRIDEIYSHTFWPWIRDRRPDTRLYFCDPFGHTDPDHLYNFGDDERIEKQYVFMHDQEPIQLNAHSKLFNEVVRRNEDMDPSAIEPAPGTVIVSELGDNVSQLESIYGWRSLYYFFHGWACLDWYRGYDRTFLFPHPRHRPCPSHTFISPNRIIGGERDHRVLFLYHVISKKMQHNYVSAPKICPSENISVTEIAKHYCNIYPDIEQVLSAADLPWLFQNETTQQMTSCWLGNYFESTNSLIYVVTETVYFGRRTHITEKTFKPIALGMPFMLVAAAGSLEYLRRYGFKTFDSIWDESYDQEQDDILRLEKVTDLLKSIDSLGPSEKKQIQHHAVKLVEHNWDHFYKGGLEKILWSELCGVLDAI